MVDGPKKINPQRIPGNQPNLNEAEAQKAKQGKPGQNNAQDAARIASQAGFRKLGAKKGNLPNIGDSSDAPIPLPGDEMEMEEWTEANLNEARESLSLAGGQLEEVATSDETNLGDIAASSFLPTEDGVAKMQDLADRPAPEPIPMEEVSARIDQLFGINLDSEPSVQRRVLATGLVVAGERESVEVSKKGVNEKKLTRGVQKVTEKCNRRVDEAQKDIKGINKELSVHRTFVVKR